LFSRSRQLAYNFGSSSITVYFKDLKLASLAPGESTLVKAALSPHGSDLVLVDRAGKKTSVNLSEEFIDKNSFDNVVVVGFNDSGSKGKFSVTHLRLP
jgi:hypothetical protein